MFSGVEFISEFSESVVLTNYLTQQLYITSKPVSKVIESSLTGN